MARAKDSPARVAIALAIPAIAVFAFTRAYHEFWRDEIQALLLGRDVPLGSILGAMRYEGTPPLFHLLLKILCLAFAPPTALALGGAAGYAILLAGTYHLLRVVSRRPRASLGITLALALTNTYAYELGVVCRSYGIGLGLDLAGIAELMVALRLRRPRRALQGALLCGLGALTSAHAACVAGAALASYAIVTWMRDRRVDLIKPTLAALPSFALVAYVISPFADRTPEAAAPGNPGLKHALALAYDFLSSGGLAGGWWHHEGTEPPPRFPIFPLFAAAIALLAALRVTSRRRDRLFDLFPLGVLILSWATLLYIFIAWYFGGYRHHLFLWIPTLVVAIGLLADGRFARGRARIGLAAAAILLVPWAGYQLHLSWDDFTGDLRGAFSQTRAAAAALPEGAQVVSDHDYSIVGIRLYRDDVTLRSQDGQGRVFGHLIVDRLWHQRAAIRPLVRAACAAAPDRTVLAHGRGPLVGSGRCLARIQGRDALLPTERFDLYRVDCACAARWRGVLDTRP